MAEQAKDDKPFLSRWSERKRAVQAEEGAQESTPAPDEHAEARAAEEEQAEHDANRAAAEAIDLETLNDASDYAPFFKAGVPAALKHAALRKLWRSNPVFAVLDGLNDYDLDYTWPKSGSEVVKTAWKVGRGFLSGDDEAAAEGVGKPAEDSVAVRAPTQPEESAGEADAEAPPAAAEATEFAADTGEHPQSETDPEPEADEPEPVKVSLSRRLDFAAFAKESGGR